MLDFNNAKKLSAADVLIPHGTAVAVEVRIRAGGAGDDGWLKRSSNGTCLLLDAEFVVLKGEYMGRRFWTLMTVEGETEGHRKAAEITIFVFVQCLRAPAPSIRPTGVKPL
jgi:hypothetical protein